jgi:hypothetical protein
MIIMLFENARCTCDSDPIHLDASGVTKKVDIWSEPTSMITFGNLKSIAGVSNTVTAARQILQFPQMVGRFVIPTDDYGQYRCHCLARIIPWRMKASF